MNDTHLINIDTDILELGVRVAWSLYTENTGNRGIRQSKITRQLSDMNPSWWETVWT